MKTIRCWLITADNAEFLTTKLIVDEIDNVFAAQYGSAGMQTFAAHSIPHCATTLLSMGLLKLRVSNTPRRARFQIEKLKSYYIYVCKSIHYIKF